MPRRQSPPCRLKTKFTLKISQRCNLGAECLFFFLDSGTTFYFFQTPFKNSKCGISYFSSFVPVAFKQQLFVEAFAGHGEKSFKVLTKSRDANWDNVRFLWHFSKTQHSHVFFSRGDGTPKRRSAPRWFFSSKKIAGRNSKYWTI